MTFDPRDPAFFDVQAVEKELARVTEICDGCRRCHRLCPSFDHMLERVDAHEGDVSRVTSADFRRLVDLCWQCKLCFNHCPYTPPHRWDIDFPRLMLRAKAARARAEGVTRQDRWLGDVDRVGALASKVAPLANFANGFRPHRIALEAAVGVHRDRNLPRFHHKTFARWFREREAPAAGRSRPVALFFSCSVNYNEPQVGRDAVAVLERNDCRVSCPEQVCCGMPYLDGGDLARATANAQRNLQALAPLVNQGVQVIVPQPTCSYVLKHEYPLLAPGPEAEAVSAATRDVFEYLAGRRAEGTLDTDFPGRRPGKVAYQVPCHLRAQNMGFKTRDVLQAIPGTQVSVVERCTAMDGTWAMKKEFFPISLTFARRAVDEMQATEPDVLATDCTLSALQIEAAHGGRPAHPLTLLREAYGLRDER
ncbi:MAG TPA: heterodisulfide reductase-related iron-sulfur binding cluster [Vicinamibacteria bacterium]|nr:heterodisulfide reductase-related iron-sulfur binding cluster [Vicinamibacteria bacterium]